MPLRFGKKDKEGQTTVDSILSAADELAKLTNLKMQEMIREEEFIRMKQELKNPNRSKIIHPDRGS